MIPKVRNAAENGAVARTRLPIRGASIAAPWRKVR